MVPPYAGCCADPPYGRTGWVDGLQNKLNSALGIKKLPVVATVPPALQQAATPSIANPASAVQASRIAAPISPQVMAAASPIIGQREPAVQASKVVAPINSQIIASAFPITRQASAQAPVTAQAQVQPISPSLFTGRESGKNNQTDVGGSIKIQIDQDGRAKVREAKSLNPKVPLSVDTGLMFAAP